MTGAVSGILDTAGSLFGGIFGSAANVGDRVRSATWERDHDNAWETAVREALDDFVQCPHCSQYVCRTSCFNEKKGLCKSCAPDVGVEMAAAQSSKTREEIWAHAAMAEEDKHLGKENWREGIRATCPKCAEPLPGNVKFCPACGERVAAAHCTQCGAKLAPNAKFCAECGTKTE
jgi:membrane protease subunit (stomatin/prohibitin family)